MSGTRAAKTGRAAASGRVAKTGRAASTRLSFPGSLPALATLWLDSNVGITQAGGVVSQWNDRSNSGNNGTASGTAKPAFTSSAVNGMPGIDFDGVDDLMTFTNITTAAATYFVVCAQLTTSGAYKCIFSTQKHTIYARSTASDIWRGYYNPDTPSNSQLTATAAIVEVCCRAPADVDLANNGLQNTSRLGGAFNNNTTALAQVAGSFPGNVRICELIFIPGETSLSVRSQIRTYLGAKWAIAVAA